MQRNDALKRMPRKLENAIKTNDTAKVKEILAEKKYQDRYWLNAVNGSVRTPLLLALKYKSWDVAKLLLSYPNTDVNVHDHFLRAALENAVYNIEIVLLLLDDVRLNTPSKSIIDCLYSCYFNNEVHVLAILKKLIAKRVDPNIIIDGIHILLWVCLRNQGSVVRFLLAQQGLDINLHSPFTYWIDHHPSLEITNLLLAHPCIDVNSRTKDSGSLLEAVINWRVNDENQKQHIKAILSHPEIDKKWLVNSGCDFLVLLRDKNQNLYNQVINDNSTEISIVSSQDEQARVMHISINIAATINLLMTNADFDINDLYSNGQSLLTMAISKGWDEIVNQLLACPRTDLHRQDKFSNSALTQANRCSKLGLVEKIMLHPRFNLLATYHYNQNLLMHTAENNCAYMTMKLLELNAFPINQTDDNGNTALNLLAQHHKNPQDASLFLKFIMHGADPMLRNHLGSNAIMSAQNNKLHGIACDLKEAAQSVLQRNHEPSAPPMSIIEDAYLHINAAAQVPPQRYYEHGLFSGSGPANMGQQETYRDINPPSHMPKSL